MDEYEFAVHETKTHQVIEDVRNFKSEIGILYVNDFNRKVLTKMFHEYGLEFHELLNCRIYVYMWKGHPLAKREKITLEEKQKLAIKNAVNNGVAVITGGPGTGKTTTINAMIKMFEKLNLELLLAAPTGRAAKRITEATGYTAQTLHRLLELSGGGIDEEDTRSAYTFVRNSNNPLDADVIIIDEMSMVASSLFYSLLQALMPGPRLVLEGASNQLPSFGPCIVL